MSTQTHAFSAIRLLLDCLLLGIHDNLKSEARSARQEDKEWMLWLQGTETKELYACLNSAENKNLHEIGEEWAKIKVLC